MTAGPPGPRAFHGLFASCLLRELFVSTQVSTLGVCKKEHKRWTLLVLLRCRYRHLLRNRFDIPWQKAGPIRQCCDNCTNVCHCLLDIINHKSWMTLKGPGWRGVGSREILICFFHECCTPPPTWIWAAEGLKEDWAIVNCLPLRGKRTTRSSTCSTCSCMCVANWTCIQDAGRHGVYHVSYLPSSSTRCSWICLGACCTNASSKSTS